MTPINIDKHVKVGITEYKIKMNVELTFWIALKLRLAGIYNLLDMKEKNKPIVTPNPPRKNNIDIFNSFVTKLSQTKVTLPPDKKY
jgi:hypothetical protein